MFSAENFIQSAKRLVIYLEDLHLFCSSQDAYAAFEQKVCVKGFPEYDTPGYLVAESMLSQLDDLMR